MVAHVNFTLRNLKVATNLKTGSTGRLRRSRINNFHLFYIRIHTLYAISRILSRLRLDPDSSILRRSGIEQLLTRSFTFRALLRELHRENSVPRPEIFIRALTGDIREERRKLQYRRVLHPSNNQQCIHR